MLEWKVATGDEKLQHSIDRMKQTFDSWFDNYWAHKVSREKMLSPESPVPRVYYLMCLPFDEVKEKLPNEAMEKCSDCGEMTDLWIETSFSFCDEYDCGMSLCPKCCEKLRLKIEELKGGDEDGI